MRRAGINILHKNSIFVCALGVNKLIFVGDVKCIYYCEDQKQIIKVVPPNKILQEVVTGG